MLSRHKIFNKFFDELEKLSEIKGYKTLGSVIQIFIVRIAISKCAAVQISHRFSAIYNSDNLPIQCTDQPMGSGDRTSGHSYCRLNSEKPEVADTAYMYRSISPLQCSHLQQHPLYAAAVSAGLLH